MINLSRTTFLPLLLVLLLTGILSSCIDSYNGNSGRPLIAKDSSTDDSDTTTEDDEEEVETRPDGVVLDSDFCACQDGAAAILSDCTYYCSTKTSSSQAILYIDTSLPAEIEANPTFGTLVNWCEVSIDSTAETGEPKCVLQVTRNGSTVAKINVTHLSGNALSADITDLSYDTTYIATLLQTSSGQTSSAIQFRKIDPSEDDTTTDGPLAIDPVHQYSCVSRGIASDLGSYYYEYALRTHFYYTNRYPPQAVVQGNNNVFCHNIFEFGSIDYGSDITPRLELMQAAIAVWSQKDLRMYDIELPQDGEPDINQILSDKFTAAGVTGPTSLFKLFQWWLYPEAALLTDEDSTDDDSSSGTPASFAKLGFIMQPFYDETTKESFCPAAEHYNSGSKVFAILKDFVGVDTEGIYVGVRDVTTYADTDDDGNIVYRTASPDFILIRETELKKIWFYIDNNGRSLRPTEDTIENYPIRFYWPPNEADPYTFSQGSQTRYTIKHLSELSSTANYNDSVPTTIIPGDKRFGCIPKISNDE